MKKIVVIFLCAFCLPAFALIDENINNGCNTSILNPTNNNVKMHAAFTPNTYTCDAGYFLPANTDGCRPCPPGYTCPSGTFSANDLNARGINTIGLITQSKNNVCAANLLTANENRKVVFHPIFVPNDPEVITVYFNNNGSIETTTCEANGELTLPPTPTRVGYTFTG